MEKPQARNGNETTLRALMKCQHHGQQGVSVDQCGTCVGDDCVTRMPSWKRNREMWLYAQACDTASTTCKDRTREWILRSGLLSPVQIPNT